MIKKILKPFGIIIGSIMMIFGILGIFILAAGEWLLIKLDIL